MQYSNEISHQLCPLFVFWLEQKTLKIEKTGKEKSLTDSKKSNMKWLSTFWVKYKFDWTSLLINCTVLNLWNCTRFISIQLVLNNFNQTNFFFRSRDRQISQKGNDGDDKNEQEGLLESYKPTFFDEISRRRRCVLTEFSPI